jgi:SAM-dependent methyltransferase
MGVPECHLCRAGEISILPRYSPLHRVTSDCKPWPPGGQLGVCERCGAAQAIISPQWKDEARAIYDGYTIYHQGGGAEQSVFDSATGAPKSRSARLLHRLSEELELPAQGRFLDVGCGNGNTLRAFNHIAPDWALAGLDVNERYKETVEAIPGVQALYTGEAQAMPGEFQVITLIHSLEHIAEPVKFLRVLWDKLAMEGVLVIQVPDCWRNPFMFLVADHATHFYKPILRDVVAAGGYHIAFAVDDWIPKELTVIGRKSSGNPPPPVETKAPDNIAAVERRVEWVVALGKEVRALAAKNNLGIFGTSIAGTWLHGELQGGRAFFVDEDPARIGQTLLGRPILRPRDVPPGSDVMIALPTPMAEQVRSRLARETPGVNWLVPAVLPE